jgi:hypothetical protein
VQPYLTRTADAQTNIDITFCNVNLIFSHYQNDLNEISPNSLETGNIPKNTCTSKDSKSDMERFLPTLILYHTDIVCSDIVHRRVFESRNPLFLILFCYFFLFYSPVDGVRVPNAVAAHLLLGFTIKT